jgi:hypothetical protein
MSRKLEAIQIQDQGSGRRDYIDLGSHHPDQPYRGTIATVVEEQDAITNEMSRQLNDTAHGSVEITRKIAAEAEAMQPRTRGATDNPKGVTPTGGDINSTPQLGWPVKSSRSTPMRPAQEWRRARTQHAST